MGLCPRMQLLLERRPWLGSGSSFLGLRGEGEYRD